MEKITNTKRLDQSTHMDNSITLRLEQMKVPELKLLCKQNHVEKYYKMNKSQLIQALKKFSTAPDKNVKLDIKPIQKTLILDVKFELLHWLKELKRNVEKINKWEFQDVLYLEKIVNIDNVVTDNIEKQSKNEEIKNEREIKEVEKEYKTRKIFYKLDTDSEGKVLLSIKIVEAPHSENDKDENFKLFIIEKQTIEMWNEIVEYLRNFIYLLGNNSVTNGICHWVQSLQTSDSKKSNENISQSKFDSNSDISRLIPNGYTSNSQNLRLPLNRFDLRSQNSSLTSESSSQSISSSLDSISSMEPRLVTKQKTRPLFEGRKLPSNLNKKKID